jgi:Rad/Gem-related GTP binding protein 1
MSENHTIYIWDITLQWFVLISEARHLAITHDCKYIETSATLDHHVNELLVGILTQIKLKLNPDFTEEKITSASKDTTCFKGLFNKLFHLKPKVQTTFNVF